MFSTHISHRQLYLIQYHCTPAAAAAAVLHTTCIQHISVLHLTPAWLLTLHTSHLLHFLLAQTVLYTNGSISHYVLLPHTHCSSQCVVVALVIFDKVLFCMSSISDEMVFIVAAVHIASH